MTQELRTHCVKSSLGVEESRMKDFVMKNDIRILPNLYEIPYTDKMSMN